MLNQLIKEVKSLENREKAKILMRFFKTGKGEYGEGDVFLGIQVPISRTIVKKYWKNLTLSEVEELIRSPIHEHRLIGLMILVEKYQKSKTTEEKEKIFDFYTKNTKRVNNWDLVDSSADRIIGSHLFEGDKSLLYKLAKSDNIWERRISIISTFYFIKKGKFVDTLKISELLLTDKQDLIHKAVGWMLREMGKRGGELELLGFLDKNHKVMPRTMLRYAIEKLDQETKKKYMAK
ncbi:MAG: DNA alkylation repair protein [Candidatus Bilamarchaeum sp.]|jgi:3-methyladenine DNA glycosylase AlkD